MSAHASSPARPFECATCEAPINSREAHHVSRGRAWCHDCAGDARAG